MIARQRLNLCIDPFMPPITAPRVESMVVSTARVSTLKGAALALIQLVYASESRLVEANRHHEIDRIVESARRLNARNHITGFLLATAGAFAQILEGDEVQVAETYGRIAADPRHGGLRLLVEAPIERRCFARWSMGLAERDETTSFIFGLYGITPEVDLPQQDAEVIVDLAGELARQHG